VCSILNALIAFRVGKHEPHPPDLMLHNVSMVSRALNLILFPALAVPVLVSGAAGCVGTRMKLPSASREGSVPSGSSLDWSVLQKCTDEGVNMT